jgi:hypothetical protein
MGGTQTTAAAPTAADGNLVIHNSRVISIQGSEELACNNETSSNTGTNADYMSRNRFQVGKIPTWTSALRSL